MPVPLLVICGPHPRRDMSAGVAVTRPRRILCVRMYASTARCYWHRWWTVMLLAASVAWWAKAAPAPLHHCCGPHHARRLAARRTSLCTSCWAPYCPRQVYCVLVRVVGCGSCSGCHQVVITPSRRAIAPLEFEVSHDSDADAAATYKMQAQNCFDVYRGEALAAVWLSVMVEVVEEGTIHAGGVARSRRVLRVTASKPAA